MDIWGIVLIVSLVILVVGIGFYFLNSWAGKKAAAQNEMLEQHKQTVSIYVIDKKKDKITNANMPKAIVDQMPRTSKLMKMPLVKAKIGPQIMTLISDPDTFKVLPIKKTVSVELAGAYIVGMKGMKTKMQLDEQRKSRRKQSGDSDAPLKWHEKLLARFGR